MGVVSGIVVYLCVWWTLLFCTLPIGVRPHDDERYGTAGSAPEIPYLKEKFILTSLLSVVVWIIIYVMIEMRVVDFPALAEQLWAQH